MKQLKKVREDGYAIDREEHANGVCGLGVVIRTSLPERYAISLAVPAARFAEHQEMLLTSLLQCKAEIESLTLI
jgi:DNA-binding IclR family transcriptional regulator